MSLLASSRGVQDDTVIKPVFSSVLQEMHSAPQCAWGVHLIPPFLTPFTTWGTDSSIYI